MMYKSQFRKMYHYDCFFLVQGHKYKYISAEQFILSWMQLCLSIYELN